MAKHRKKQVNRDTARLVVAAVGAIAVTLAAFGVVPAADRASADAIDDEWASTIVQGDGANDPARTGTQEGVRDFDQSAWTVYGDKNYDSETTNQSVLNQQAQGMTQGAKPYNFETSELNFTFKMKQNQPYTVPTWHGRCYSGTVYAFALNEPNYGVSWQNPSPLATVGAFKAALRQELAVKAGGHYYRSIVTGTLEKLEADTQLTDATPLNTYCANASVWKAYCPEDSVRSNEELPRFQAYPRATREAYCGTYKNAAINLTKTIDGQPQDTNSNGVLDAGDTLHFKFTAANGGDVKLIRVRVQDPLVERVTCPASVIARQSAMECSGSYTLTQADFDTGEVVSPASTSGVSFYDESTVTANDSVTYDLSRDPAISLTKSVRGGVQDSNGNGLQDAGDTISYDFRVENTGDGGLTAVTVEDALLGNGVTCPRTDLEAQEAMTCTGDYVLTDADLDAGQVENSATAYGTSPYAAEPITSNATVTQELEQEPFIALSATSSRAYVVSAGEEIEYAVTVTNTGNVTLADIAVVNETLGWTSHTCGTATLKATQATTCKGTYEVKASDLSATHVVMTATVRGVSPRTEEVTATTTVKTFVALTPLEPTTHVVIGAGL